MADAFFDAGLNGILAGEIDFDTATIKCMLVRGYTFNAAHVFVSDATGAATGPATIVSTTPALATKTIGVPGPGVADAADTAWEAVATGSACEAFFIVQTSAVGGGLDVAAGSQRLIARIDSYTGLPVTPNGANINLTFPGDANRIFKI